MNFSYSFITVIAAMFNPKDNGTDMTNAFIKYISSLLVVTGFFGVQFETFDITFHLGCYASIFFGILLQLSIIRRTQPLTFGLVCWHVVTTLGICWVAFLYWSAKNYGYSMWFMLYLFGVSFFSVIILNTAQKLGKIGIPNGAKMIFKQYFFADDKEEENK